MDKLEHYLDQVCRGVGGPRSLRQHIRQELREHLLDAAAEHRAAGLTEDEALARALDDFGGPEQVRRELEDTHGHRVMAVIIDKAMQWKEMTMKAKWLWTSWAHVALLIVIAMEVIFVGSAMVFIVPKFKQIMEDLGPAADALEPIMSWARGLFAVVAWIVDTGVWWLILLAVAWLLFEWRVRSENKPFMRLAALGSAAVVLMVAVAMTGLVLVVPLTMAAPGMNTRLPEPIVKDELATIDTSIAALDQAMAKKDWEAMSAPAIHARNAMGTLSRFGAAAPVLASLQQQQKVDELRTQLKSAAESLSQAQWAIWRKDSVGLDEAMRKFHDAYGPVQRATTRPAMR